MWLIRVKDEVLVYFLYEQRPQYAILSHRWDTQNPEVSFNDMQDPEKAMGMKSYQKIRQTCNVVAARGLEYVWIDTCCINKDSSAELSEAINSMYRWYQGAEICYAYLVDVELIAPKELYFLNTDWITLGTKSSLVETVHKKTGIALEVLTGQTQPITQSIAQRMSWASRRKTTRLEDQAYCLLGIFDVNMPLLYGEGDKAFLRLQETILSSSSDHSIFAWPVKQQNSLQALSRASTPASTDYPLYGLLADSPASFLTCGNVKEKFVFGYHSAYAVTNRGLSIELQASLIAVDTFMVFLECDDDQMANKESCYKWSSSCLTIFVVKLDDDGHFARTCLHDEPSIARLTGKPLHFSKQLRMCVPLQSKHLLDPTKSRRRKYVNGFQINSMNSWRPSDMTQDWQWDSEKRPITFMPKLPSSESNPILENPVILIHESNQKRRILYMFLSFALDGAMVCIIQTQAAFESGPKLGDECLTDYSGLSVYSKRLSKVSRAEDFYHHSRNGVWAVKCEPGGSVMAYLVSETTNYIVAKVSICPRPIIGGTFHCMWTFAFHCYVFPLPWYYEILVMFRSIGRRFGVKGRIKCCF